MKSYFFYVENKIYIYVRIPWYWTHTELNPLSYSHYTLQCIKLYKERKNIRKKNQFYAWKKKINAILKWVQSPVGFNSTPTLYTCNKLLKGIWGIVEKVWTEWMLKSAPQEMSAQREIIQDCHPVNHLNHSSHNRPSLNNWLKLLKNFFNRSLYEDKKIQKKFKN